MGIQGLISFVKEATENVQLEKLRGSRVAIDSYCWLHKGAFSCAEKLAIGQKTDQYVQYCMNYIKMLKYHNITPIMVFDGRHLSAKQEEEKSRREERKKKRSMAAQLLRAGQSDKARRYLASSIDVTHVMALELIKACRAINIDCIVAPYEADAQLAFLNINNYVDYVITEDSDLILFGCHKVLFKLQRAGTALLYDSDKLPQVMKLATNVFDFSLFRRMCVLSGCDYLSSLPGIGLIKAKKFVIKTRGLDISEALLNIALHLNMPKLEVTPEYIANFAKAEATFLYQYVYNPKKRKMVRLTEPPSDINQDLLELSGDYIEDMEAFQHALGNIDPFSKKKLDFWDPDKETLLPTSIWNQNANIRQLKMDRFTNVNPGFNVTSKVTVKRAIVIEESEAFDADILDEYKTAEVHVQKRQKIEEVSTTTATKRAALFPIKTREKIVEENSEDLNLNEDPPSEQKSPILNRRPIRKIIQSKFLNRTRSENISNSTSLSCFFKKSVSVPELKSVTVQNSDTEDQSPSCSQSSNLENEDSTNEILPTIDDDIIDISCEKSTSEKFKKFTPPTKHMSVNNNSSPLKNKSPLKNSPQMLVPARRQGLSRIQKLNKPANNSSQKLLSQFGFVKKPQLGP